MRYFICEHLVDYPPKFLKDIYIGESPPAVDGLSFAEIPNFEDLCTFLQEQPVHQISILKDRTCPDADAMVDQLVQWADSHLNLHNIMEPEGGCDAARR